MSAQPPGTNKQLLHIVLGGELTESRRHRIQGSRQGRNRRRLPQLRHRYAAWKAKAQQTVDNAHMRYFIVHLHRLLDPEATERAAR